MCEPNHSIVQFHNDDDDDRLGGGGTSPEAIPAPAGTDKSFWEEMRRRVGKWFHFSLLGNGHSETVASLTIAGRRFIGINETRYETQWWERQTVIDGGYFGHQYESADALAAADKYARMVSIGNLTQLRQFLTRSMQASKRPFQYVEQFRYMLTSKGKVAFDNTFKRVFPAPRESLWYLNARPSNPAANLPLIQQLINFCLGWTRKRNLLVPAWADDDQLWKPSQPRIVTA